MKGWELPEEFGTIVKKVDFGNKTNIGVFYNGHILERLL